MIRKSKSRSGKGCVCGSSYPEGYLESCRAAMETALSKVPAYRSWKSFDGGEEDPFERLAGLPLVDKEAMRRYGPEGFVPEGTRLAFALAKGRVEIVKTSGSTGDMVDNVWSQAWWDASESASWRLNSHASELCSGSHREAILASPLCVGFPCEDSYLPIERRTLGRLLFLNERMDPTQWTPWHMRRMVEELDFFAPEVLEANPSYLARLCRFMDAEGLKARSPSLIVFTYENPSALHLRQIAKAFKSPFASSYGSTETGYVFMQCEHGLLHQNVERCHVDFIPFSEQHGGPELGSLAVTTFDNPWRSLLRFDIGDVARLAKEPCPCGRKHGLTLSSIEGRAANITLACDGRAVTQGELDRALSCIGGLEDYQLLQTSRRSYSLRFAASGRQSGPQLRQALKRVYGKGGFFELEELPSLAPEPPGKRRLAKPLIPIDPKSFWEPSASPPLKKPGGRPWR